MTASVPVATSFFYTGDGSTTGFSFPLRFLENGDVQVYVDGVLKTITTHYTLSGAGGPSGGTVTFVAAPAADADIELRRATLAKQTVDLSDSGRTPGDTLEGQLDRLAMAGQDQASQVAVVVGLADDLDAAVDDAEEAAAVAVPAAAAAVAAQAAAEAAAADAGNKVGGSVGATDNAIPRADGTGTKTLQSSGVLIGDTDYMSGVARLTIDKAPVFDLAATVLAVALMIPLAASTLTVAASKQFNFMRTGQTSGADITFAVGASGSAVGIYSSLTADATSDATSNVYGFVAHATNAGPGTVRGIHAGGYATTGSTGPVNAVGAQLMPVSTSGFTSGLFVALNSTGVHDKAFGVAVESNNADRYSVAYGNGLAALPIGTAYFRAWLATASSANARAFQLLDNGGSEIAYWSKAGDVVAPNLIASSATNGITISQAAVTRNNAAGSMTFAAGTNAGNTFAVQTGGSTRFDVSDTASRAAGFLHSAFNTAPPAGGTTSVGIKVSSTSNLGIYVGTGAPTLSAGKGSLYSRVDGTTTTTRLYINTDGGTTWATFTASA